MVVGKQKDLVQRILYVLTYFLRCSELQENQLTWSGSHGEGDQVLNGGSITTALERGEVEESEYVVVTVRSEPALLPPVLPLAMVTAEGRGPGPEGLTGTPEDSDIRDPCPKPDKEGNKSSAACSLGYQDPALDNSWKPQDAFCGDEESEKEAPPDGCSRFSSCDALGAGLKISEELKGEMPKKLPDRSAAWPCPDRLSREKPLLEKVTFQIGSSVSPESDLESRTQKMEEWLKACRQYPEVAGCPVAEPRVATAMPQDQQVSRCSFLPGFRQTVCCPQNQPSEGNEGGFDRDYAEDRGFGTEAAADAVGQLDPPADSPAPDAGAAGTGQRAPQRTRGMCPKEEGSLVEPVPGRCVQQDSGVSVATDVPYGDTDRTANFRTEGDIPRNESSDSALGDSDDEACSSAALNLGHSSDRTEGSLEVELPLPR